MMDNAITSDRLAARRKALRMPFTGLSALSGVSEPAVRRILGGQLAEASFGSVIAVARVLGVSIGFDEPDPDEMCRQQALKKAAQITRLVQGTMALANQAVDATAYQLLIKRSYYELLAGSKRRLWSV